MKIEACKTYEYGPVNDDGMRCLIPVWEVVIDTPEAFLVHPHVFQTEEAANRFVDRVVARGTIQRSLWNECPRNHDLPDYVTHWYRPEFN